LPIPSEGPVAAGVIGLAGDLPIPPISLSGNTGVFGAGPIGVRGVGVKGVGGYFDSREVAQTHLEPHKPFLNDPNGQIDGQAGDLLVVQGDESGSANLYFCQRTGNMGWKMVAFI
jgi:hypothetical protein